MVIQERNWLVGLGIIAAIAGCAAAVVGILFAVDLIADRAVLFADSQQWGWSFSSQPSEGAVLFAANLPGQSSPQLIALPTPSVPLASRIVLAVVALAEAAVPAAIAFGAARAARLTVRGGLVPRLPRLAWTIASTVVVGVVVATIGQLVAGGQVSLALGVHDPLQLGWAFDAVCLAVALCLAIGGLILRLGARLQRDTEGLV